jgi:hypothetical protein
LSVPAIVVGAENLIGSFDRDKFKARLWAPLILNTADEHLDAIRLMKDSRTVAVASYSQAFLRTCERLGQRSFGREALVSGISFSHARTRGLPGDGFGFLRFADGTTA